MQINHMFLAAGLVLSVISKVLQFKYKMKIGDIIVIPAAMFFVLAILFSLSKFKNLLTAQNGMLQAGVIALLACLSVVCFQIMMILLISHHNKLGFAFIVPFLLAAGAFIYKWMALV